MSRPPINPKKRRTSKTVTLDPVTIKRVSALAKKNKTSFSREVSVALACHLLPVAKRALD